ncbi:amidohydrolase [bacterium]|nr:amidohydrolase [bacterium]
MRSTIALCACLLFTAAAVRAADGDLRLLDWRPKSQLVVKETEVLRPRFPVIDIHNHLGMEGGLAKTAQYVAAMDSAGIIQCVSLDGLSNPAAFGELSMPSWREHLENAKKLAPGRIIVFFSPDFSYIDDPQWGARESAQLTEAVRAGARGVKIFKTLGLTLRDKSGKLIPVDDPRIDPFWDTCGKLGIPVMIHVSDPKAFFTPVDKYNERYDELGEHPDWAFGDTTKYPSKWEILAQRNRMFAKHPGTIYIGAHMGTLPEELHQVGMWLDAYPNLYVDIDARIAELGRQPYTARRFMLRYADRVMFGTDSPPHVGLYRTYFRFLETDDECFDYSAGLFNQGRWGIYGLFLPDEVLEKIYNANARKIFAQFKGAPK